MTWGTIRGGECHESRRNTTLVVPDKSRILGSQVRLCIFEPQIPHREGNGPPEVGVLVQLNPAADPCIVESVAFFLHPWNNINLLGEERNQRTVGPSRQVP